MGLHTRQRAGAFRMGKGVAVMVLGGFLLALQPQPVAAAGNTCTWTGSGTDSNWSTSGNWSGCAGAAPTNNDDLVFPSLANRKTNTNDLNNLIVNNIDIFDGYTIGGNAFTLKNTIDADTTVNQGTTINNNLTMGPHTSFGGHTVITHSTAAARPFDLNGAITFATSMGQVWVNGGYVNLGVTTGGTFAMRLDDTHFSVADGSDFVTGAGVYLTGDTRLMCSHNDCGGNNAVYLFVGENASVSASGDFTLHNHLFCSTTAPCIYTDTPGSNVMVNSSITIEGGVPTSVAALNAGDTSLVLNGQIQGVGDLQLGPGNITLNALNTYDGDTFVATDTTVTSGHADSYGPAGNTVHVAGKLALTGNDDYVLAATIDGAGQVELTGSGEHSFTALDTFTGLLIINDDTVYTVNGNGAQNATITVDGGRLQGAGNIGNTTFTSGTLAPGNSPGLLTITGDLILAASPSTFAVELNGTAAGSGYDQVIVQDAAQLNNSQLQITLGFTPTVGDSFSILRAATIAGQFNGLADGDSLTIDGTTFTIRYLINPAGEDSVVLRVAAIPNASTGQLAATGQSAIVMGAIGGLLVVFGAFLVIRLKLGLR